MSTGGRRIPDDPRPHVIRRPRLTRVLDTATTRVAVIVAPAGYGKTVLAEEWARTRAATAWYRCSTASSDPAALVAGLAEAAEAVVPEASTGISERLHDAATLDQAASLAGVLAHNLESWPKDALLVVDDYQFVGESGAAEAVFEVLVASTPVRLLITSRRRPRWVTPRALLYGEVLEIGKAPLAMTLAEARRALPFAPQQVPGIVALAEGWPAVIGLAALARDFKAPADEARQTLYDFFAEEVLNQVQPVSRRDILLLGVLPSLDREVVATVMNPDQGAHALAEAAAVGIVSSFRQPPTIHPLFREFMTRKLLEDDPETLTAIARDVGQRLVRHQRWDDAFEIVVRFKQHELFQNLLETALEPLLSEGRLRTISRWVEFAQSERFAAPIVDLARAEVAARGGSLDEAEALAVEAARALHGAALESRAYATAGRAAHLADREEAAVEHFAVARKTATTQHDLRRALWGEFVAHGQIAPVHPQDLIYALEEASDGSPEARLRLAHARVSRAMRTGGLAEAVAHARDVWRLADRVADPNARTGFGMALAHASAHLALYDDARRVGQRAGEDAELSGLTFVRPHAAVMLALVLLGHRQHDEALRLLRQAESDAGAANTYARLHIAIVTAQVHLSRGDVAAAREATDARWPKIGSNVDGEFLSTRAFVHACAGDADSALALATAAEAMARGIETRVFNHCTRATVRRMRDAGAPDDACDAFRLASELGSLHSFLIVCRAQPWCAEHVAAEPTLRPAFVDLLRRASDHDLARALGIRDAIPREGSLSQRETEVYRLVARGLTNREIAEELVIAEVTVKVHVRHILAKLGVQRRSQLAALAAMEPTRQLRGEIPGSE